MQRLKDLSNEVTLQTVMINKMIHSLSFSIADDGEDHDKLLKLFEQHADTLGELVALLVKAEENIWRT